MNGKLYRWNWAKDCTQAVMQFDGLYLHTIERPWVRHPDRPGGENEVSCIGPGKYELVPFKRPNGDSVYMLLNPALGVYDFEEDLPDEGGRFLILIHAGNWAKDVKGCIAPGMTETHDGEGNPMVSNSKTAIQKIMSMLDSHANNTLEIVP